jgi:beta-catenin-like protein 1
MPDMPSAEVLKKMRLDSEGSSSVTTVLEPIEPRDPVIKSRRATVEDTEDDDDYRPNDNDFAPGNDADYFAEEDDEGRFYGGGLTKQQKEILSIFEKAAGDDGVVDDDVRTFSGLNL